MKTGGRKTKVLVAVEPITLRSALRAVLGTDPRLEVVELSADIGLEQAAAEADIVLVTRATDSSLVPVVLIDQPTGTVEVNGAAARRVFRYQGLPWLADLLVAWPDLAGAHDRLSDPASSRGKGSEATVSWPSEGGDGWDAHERR